MSLSYQSAVLSQSPQGGTEKWIVDCFGYLCNQFRVGGGEPLAAVGLALLGNGHDHHAYHDSVVFQARFRQQLKQIAGKKTQAAGPGWRVGIKDQSRLLLQHGVAVFVQRGRQYSLDSPQQ